MGIANSYFDTNFADWQTAGDVCDANITPFSGASQIDLMDSHAVVDTSKKAIQNGTMSWADVNEQSLQANLRLRGQSNA